MDFREWPPRRILLLSVVWILAIRALSAFLLFRMVSAAEAGGGVGAFSLGILESATVLLGPPLLLWLLWLILRRRPAASQ
jgi:hypothetical protein